MWGRCQEKKPPPFAPSCISWYVRQNVTLSRFCDEIRLTQNHCLLGVTIWPYNERLTNVLPRHYPDSRAVILPAVAQSHLPIYVSSMVESSWMWSLVGTVVMIVGGTPLCPHTSSVRTEDVWKWCSWCSFAFWWTHNHACISRRRPPQGPLTHMVKLEPIHTHVVHHTAIRCKITWSLL